MHLSSAPDQPGRKLFNIPLYDSDIVKILYLNKRHIIIIQTIEAKSFLFQYIYCAYLGPKIKLRVFPQFCQNIHFFNCFGYNRDYRVAWINNNKYMIFGLQGRLAQFHQDFPSSSFKSPSFGKSYSTRGWVKKKVYKRF